MCLVLLLSLSLTFYCFGIPFILFHMVLNTYKNIYCFIMTCVQGPATTHVRAPSEPTVGPRDEGPVGTLSGPR